MTRLRHWIIRMNCSANIQVERFCTCIWGSESPILILVKILSTKFCKIINCHTSRLHRLSRYVQSMAILSESTIFVQNVMRKLVTQVKNLILQSANSTLPIPKNWKNLKKHLSLNFFFYGNICKQRWKNSESNSL